MTLHRRHAADDPGAAGVEHPVGISIVGVEQVPTRYHRAKCAQEQAIVSGPAPWTIVCSTQSTSSSPGWWRHSDAGG